MKRQRMTKRQCLEKLAGARDVFRWYMEPDGSVRARRKDEVFVSRERFSLKRRIFCPITAAYYLQRGEFLEDDEFESAARRMRLPVAQARLIAHAADADDYGTLRSDLLRAVGLEERTVRP